MVALAAATRNVVEVCKVDSDLGRLESGRMADIPGLEKKPLEGDENCRSNVEVVKDGEAVDRSALPAHKVLTVS